MPAINSAPDRRDPAIGRATCATEFVDVRAKVQTRASERIAGAFEKDTTHAALSKVLTTLVDGFIKKVSPAGYKTLDDVTGEGGSIRVAYTPK